jgi:hypothetical protein
MTHAIIRGKNGRRREVDFGDSPVRVEVYASEETIEIFVEADFETLAEERRSLAKPRDKQRAVPRRRGSDSRRQQCLNYMGITKVTP